MSIDQVFNQLQSDLRFTIENPTADSKQALMDTLDALLNGRVKADTGRENAHWWMDRVLNAVRLFHGFPSKAGYEQLKRMSCQYHELVTLGIIEPIGIARKKQFDTLTDWFLQELEDRAYAFLSRPTDDTKRVLEDQLGRFCQLKNVSLI
jgi:hypothetical protein